MIRRRVPALVFILLLVFAWCLLLTVVQRHTSFENFCSEVFSETAPEDGSIQETQNVFQAESSPSSVYPNVSNKPCEFGSVMYGNYCVLSPYERSTKEFSSVGLVTLCTQATVEFLQHVVVLCHRWSAPISVAVYSPEADYADARHIVDLLRECDLCVRTWVNWHFFFQNKEMPEIKEFHKRGNCSSIIQQIPSKRRSEGTYPINVGRNVARRMARTSFVFSIDIELYPSLEIPTKFERMLLSSPSHEFSHGGQVWVFPIFEVRSAFRAPLSKSSLRDMFWHNLVISFHKYRCNRCHQIPNLTEWMNHEAGYKDEVEESLEPLKIWTTVKRSRRLRLQYWEPFFIGRKEDPEFDIRLSWEGKENKLQMAYEMCLRDYDFHIIENAFLVHTPGINKFNARKEQFREKHTKTNKLIMKEIKRNLGKIYTTKHDC